MRRLPHHSVRSRFSRMIWHNLLLASLMFQALIPAGMMPGNLADSDSAFVYCGVSNGQNAAIDESSPETGSHSVSGSLCSFASLSTVGALLTPVLFSPDSFARSPFPDARSRASAFPSPLHSRPPARAPPASLV